MLYAIKICYSLISFILFETLCLLLACYRSFLSHTLRQSNTLAHALANRARLSFPLLVWIFIVVLFLIYMLLNKKP